MSEKNLKGLRNKIDKIDQELYALIQKRASHAVAIGKILVLCIQSLQLALVQNSQNFI